MLCCVESCTTCEVVRSPVALAVDVAAAIREDVSVLASSAMVSAVCRSLVYFLGMLEMFGDEAQGSYSSRLEALWGDPEGIVTRVMGGFETRATASSPLPLATCLGNINRISIIST